MSSKPDASSETALIDLARAGLAGIAPDGAVGDAGRVTRGEPGTAEEAVVTVEFASLQPGYPGWVWTVALSEVDGHPPTVLEAELLPGHGALVAPEWVPWSVRMQEYTAAQDAQHAPLETLETLDFDVDDDDDDDDDIDDIDEEDLGDGDVDGVDLEAIVADFDDA